MKKIISFVGALFVGSMAIGQAGKTDTVKPVTRKVLPADVKPDTLDKLSKTNKPASGYAIKQGLSVNINGNSPAAQNKSDSAIKTGGVINKNDSLIKGKGRKNSS